MLTLTKIKRSYVIDHVMPSDLDKEDVRHGLYLKEKMLAEITDDYIKSINPDWKKIERDYRRRGLSDYMDKIMCGEMTYDEVNEINKYDPVKCECWIRWKQFNTNFDWDQNKYDFDKETGYCDWVKQDKNLILNLPDDTIDVIVQMQIVIIGDNAGKYFPFQDKSHSSGFEYVDDNLQIYDCSTWNRVLETDDWKSISGDNHLDSIEMRNLLIDLDESKNKMNTDIKLKNDYENELISLNNDLEKYTNRLTELTTLIEETNQLIEEKQNYLNYLYEQLETETDPEIIEKIKKDIDKTTQELDNLNKKVNEYQLEKNECSDKIQDINQRIIEVNIEIDRLNEEINSLQLHINDLINNQIKQESNKLVTEQQEYYRLFFRNRLGYSEFNWFKEDKEWIKENYPLETKEIRTILCDPFRIKYIGQTKPDPGEIAYGSNCIIPGKQFVKCKYLCDMVNVAQFTIQINNYHY